jgi:hypothetical protein
VDTIEGRGAAPSLVISLIERLPDTSMTVALASGGKEHFGWGLDRHMAADLYDALSTNTQASGNWGKGGPPKMPSYPRPNPEAMTPEEKAPMSVKTIFNKFAALQ